MALDRRLLFLYLQSQNSVHRRRKSLRGVAVALALSSIFVVVPTTRSALLPSRLDTTARVLSVEEVEQELDASFGGFVQDHPLEYEPPSFETTLQAYRKEYAQQSTLASRYLASISAAARTYDIPESVVVALMSRESSIGTTLTAQGHSKLDSENQGRGLMQIDARYHVFARSGNWHNARENIYYGCKLLAEYRTLLREHTSLSGVALLRATVASYNAGPDNVLKAIAQGRDVDSYTERRDYSKDVLNRAGLFQRLGWP